METDFLKQQYLLERKRRAFGPFGALQECCFAADNGQVPQILHARQYADHWEQMRRDNIGLLFWGPPGCGKTFSAACIANALMEAGSFPPEVIMSNFGTILRQLLAKSPQEKEDYMERLLGCDLLILDDLGMERQTDYAREQVFSIVDGRCLRRLPLIVTTNLTLQQLKAPESLAEQRIYDRVLELCVPVFFDGESLRRRRGAEKMQRYRSIAQAPGSPEMTISGIGPSTLEENRIL